MEMTFNWARVFKLANITESQFDDSGFEKDELFKIYRDFIAFKKDLDSLALFFVTKFLTFPRVHSVRYRVKDPEHLISKIIRKRIENKERDINIDNYKTEITDLIGIRVLHLFKNDYSSIDRNIRSKFKISPKHSPIIYKRLGDTVNLKKPFDGFEIKDHPRNYRSIHYILESTPTNNTYYVEV